MNPDKARHSTCMRMAHGDEASDILADLCRAVEAALPGTIGGVTILDRARMVFEDAVFPSLDNAYCNALKGIAVADKPGSCALAVHEGRTVECTDVETDARFAPPWTKLSLDYGMQALISIPAVDRTDAALGTLVVAYAKDRVLTDAERAMADEFAELCGGILAYRRLQAEQDLMIGEFQHRVRNFFGTVGALVYATLRSHSEPGAFRKVLDARLTALAKAHVRAIERRDTELSELLADTLAPYAMDHKIKLNGPKILLSERAAMALSLAVHELATNAAKYGALSQRDGKLEIDWSTADERSKEFNFSWREVDGPAVSAPSRQGFGQKTISKSVSAFDGLAVMHYDPQGLSCHISAPWNDRLGSLAH